MSYRTAKVLDCFVDSIRLQSLFVLLSNQLLSNQSMICAYTIAAMFIQVCCRGDHLKYDFGAEVMINAIDKLK